MVDRLAMAKQYVQEMLEKRDDIVGAFVVGSVARGEATETSDIDLALIVKGAEGDGLFRSGIDAWREGVYVEAALASKERYDDAERVLHDPITATHMNDALILHDPTGFLTGVQREVRAVFMEPEWVGARVQPAIGVLHADLAGLAAAVSGGDLVGICPRVRWLSFRLLSVPLVIAGVTPSAARAMTQLEEVLPDLTDRICTWQCSSEATAEAMAGLLHFASEAQTIGRDQFALRWGKAFEYVVSKMQSWMYHGQFREALYGIWVFVGEVAGFARTSEDDQMAAETERLVQDWFRAIGWEGQEVLEEKVRMAEEMVTEVEAMAAHLPSVQPAEPA